MNRLAQSLAALIREKVLNATQGRSGTNLESRLIFHGPPIEILETVYEELARDGGIQVPDGENGNFVTLPVLLQYPSTLAQGPNPEIGASGKCDESHLLHIRNDPNCPSFVALVPPGQHNNKSVSSTTDEFGMSATTSMGHASFDTWWDDGFVQRVVTSGLRDAGIQELDDARQLVQKSASSLDEVDTNEGIRNAAWRLLSRIYSIGADSTGLPPGTALALACGIPPMQDGSISPKAQLSILERVADELADGFKTGIERLLQGTADETGRALRGLLAHLQANCEVPTAFERATEAFYLPEDTLQIESPPSWWTILTAEQWSDLILEEQEETAGDLSIQCSNSIIPAGKGMPAVVVNEVELTISAGEERRAVTVSLTGGSFGKVPTLIDVEDQASDEDSFPPAHKTPISYKVTAAGHKTATTRVISLNSWTPGILVSSRLATKLSPPKKPRKTTAVTEWETSMSLPGSGRYELRLHASPGTSISRAEGMPDDATEFEESRAPLKLEELKDGSYQVEIEADGKYQLDITFTPSGRKPETCRVYISCEETKEEGCRSEFERLIKLNRKHLEKFDAKAVVQLDRHARSSSLQSWILDEQNVEKSFRPLVIADDFVTRWAPPDWDLPNGPILSQGRFLHDPRPRLQMFQPPHGFIEARVEIARRIRSTDEQSGLIESARLGEWLKCDPSFRQQVEIYLKAYMDWLASDRETACWVDAIAICSLGADGHTLARIPDAIILSPLHPLRLAWHCLAQQVLYGEVSGDDTRPCPAASILDPDCIPDLLTMSIQAPGGVSMVDFLSVECNSDYWSVLWNGSQLGQLADRSLRPPFDGSFGLTIGGIASGFSPAQVARALEDVSDLLAAKPVLSLVVSSAGGTTDACNEGLTSWCTRRFGDGEKGNQGRGVGPRVLEVFDTRPDSSRPDQATIANLSEDTSNSVRWFNKQPFGTKPDLGIVAQLDSAQPESTEVGMRSPLGMGGLIRHRVRRQLHGAFLCESRQGLQMPSSGEEFADRVSACILALEGGLDRKVGLQFAPNVHAVSNMLVEKQAGFVAVSSSAIDPACFLGGWIDGAYLWDYDLPAYSHRAGDTSGYYLLSQVKEADREALRRVLLPLPGCKELPGEQVEQILLEVARRGIPTVRGLSGDDTGATGDLGLFLAVRLLQDQFRLEGNLNSLLPVLAGSADDASLAIIIPVDPFRGYMADLARSLGKDRKDTSLSRPDLLVVGIHASDSKVRLHLTPIEVKYRQGGVFGANDATEALSQAKALSTLFNSIEERAGKSPIWRLAFQHLLLSMVGFGLRVYSQHHILAGKAGLWANYHERIAAAILSPVPAISIDSRGRLIVVDGSSNSGSHDKDGDGWSETIVISNQDAGRIVSGDAQAFYDSVRTQVSDWELIPSRKVSSANSIKPDVELITAVHGKAIMVPEEKPPSPIESTSPHPEASSKPPLPSCATAEPNGQGDKIASGILLSLGSTVDGFVPRPLALNISDTRLNQLNIGVVGDLGTGKTQFLKSLILQVTRASHENRGIKPRFLIFDYKRDYSTPDFIEATGARVVKPTQLPLNLFDTTSMGESSAPWLDRFRFFADVLDKVYSGIGPVQRDKLKGAVRNAYETTSVQGRQPTIYDIHAEYRELLAGKSDSPMAIIDDLVDMEVFTREPSKTVPFDEFLDGIVVISLDSMGQDDRSKNMLVAIMLNMFYENMLKTPKRPFTGTDPQLRVIDSYLLVDEADNIMRYEFDVLRKLLLQGREFGTGVILASQYLRHFKSGATDYREPLLTWFIHKVPNVTPTELNALGFTSDIAELSDRVKTLPNHHCLYKSFDVAGDVIRGLPFYELVKKT